MPKVTVVTFNCENLFRRFRFKAGFDPSQAIEEGFTIDKTKFEILKTPEKTLTGKAVKKADADVVALQEVDNMDVLRRFRSDFLKNEGYEHSILVDGNDPRQIDVAVLSRHPIVHVRSYHHLREGRSRIFSRDCLEVDIRAGNQTLTLFVNHFKSMLGGRSQTKARRQKQAEAVKQIVQDRFGATNTGSAPWIICGDLNDFIDGHEGIGAVTGWDQVENVLDRLPEADRWTHFFEDADEYRQLDYLLVSQGLAPSASVLPTVVRDGLCTNADRYTGPRFPGIGASRPAASDHCPLVIEVSV